ncbi:MAG: right-handed parallel beta-helix repeat-containing protein [Clostridia bacterium]|nr:right-handed parallel beta-helix repeat-containing protein [Clostridia bacterium]
MKAKKILAIILSAIMIVGSMTTVATAEGTATSLPEAVNSVIKLTENVVLADTYTVPADTTLTIDLAGYTISQTKTQTAGYQMILNDGNLTIKDSSKNRSGKISYTDNGNGGEYISDTIYNRGVLVIESGTIENLSTETVARNGYPHAVDTYSGIRDTSVTVKGGTIYCAEYSAIRMFCVSETKKADLVINSGIIMGAVDVQNGSKDKACLGSLTVNGGIFDSNKSSSNIRIADWHYYGSTANISGISAEIKSGSFDKGIFNNIAPVSEFVSGGVFGGDVTEFLADGATVVCGDKKYVKNGEEVTTVAATEVATYDALLEALNVDKAQIIMTADITADATQSSGYGKTGIVLDAGDILDGNGHKLTINNANTTWDTAIAMKGGTVKNLTIAGAMRGIFMPGANGNVVIDNCVFEDVIYTFNSDAGSKGCSVTITDTKLFGWTSFSNVHKSVTFENCEFGEGSGYSYCRPYQPTTFTGCEFNEGYEFDTTRVNDNTHAFNECTYDGEALSADNSSMFYDGGSVLINGTATDVTQYAAKVGNVKYNDIQEAIKAAAPAGTVTLLKDVTVDKWVMISETLSIGNNTIINLDMDGLTIDGNGHTLTINDVESASNGNHIFYDGDYNIYDLNLVMGANVNGLGITSGTIKNVTFTGGCGISGGAAIHVSDGLITGVHAENVTIEGCTFNNNGGAIYSETAQNGLVVKGNTFQVPSGANVIMLRGTEQLINNTVLSGRTVNVVSGSPVVTGNNFGDVRLKVYNVAAATISDNTINVLAFQDDTVPQSTFTNNTLSEAAQAVLDAVQKDKTLPNAEVRNLGSVTIPADTYICYPNGATDKDLELDVAMQFIAKDTPEEAAENYYGNYTTDFFIEFGGLTDGVLDTTGCYLAGNYGEFGWIAIPVDGMIETVEEGVVYPVLSGATPFDFKYVDICREVKDFTCGIYFSDDIKEKHPNITVKLSLGLSETLEYAQRAEFTTVGAYTYDQDDFGKKLVNWGTGTDAGYYMDDETKYGMMRFLFHADIDAEDVKDSGIKYIRTDDITATVVSKQNDEATNAFYGDVIGIPEGTTGEYAAVAYVITSKGLIYWSDAVECSPDFDNDYSGYNAQ